MNNLHNILLRPPITEKTTDQKADSNQMVFVVNRNANKIEIRRAVEKAFDVRVLSVNTSNMRGKKKRVGRFLGKRPDWKKAVVTLALGDRIDFFEGA